MRVTFENLRIFFLFQNNINLQLGIAPVIVPMLTDKSCLALIEDSTPVNVRLLKKAFNPPVTIKTFFKPSSKPNDPEIPSAKTDSSNDQISVIPNDKSLSIEQDPQISKTSSTGNTKTTSECFITKFSKSSDKARNSEKDGNKLKRTAESSLTQRNSSKRCKKQGNILSSLQNSSRQRETRECPICKLIFSPAANNKEINDHMDSCLIE